MKKIHKFFGVILACAMLFSLCACGEGTPIPNPTPPAEAQTYTIQYADEEGIHTFEVTQGKLYSISPVPVKTGYEFLGLYDAEVGGTQYVNSKGSGLSVFTDGEDKILYPQFKPKEYTLVLDYQGAAVTGSRSLKVEYDSEIRELPMNVALENKEFMGWYTEPEKKGTQVADKYGVIPSKNVISESLFDLSDSKGYIYLYAGFKATEYTVTFYASENSAPEEVKVEYGTPISEVRTDTRVDGKAVLSWSKKKNDVSGEQIFSGKVTSDMVLYAAELAPFIEFDSNGGKKINSMIVREGEEIQLPVPERENYQFVGWQDLAGNCFQLYTMTGNNVTLTAKWQAMILFDSNGGANVEAVSAEAGSNITLPVPVRSGYIFAGWYRGNAQYSEDKMPKDSLTLKAGWYQERSARYVVCESNTEIEADCRRQPYKPGDNSNFSYGFSYHRIPHSYGLSYDAFRLVPPVDSFFGADNSQNKNFRIEFHAQVKHQTDGERSLRMAIYPTSTIISADLIKDRALATITNEWQTVEFTESLWVKGNPYIYFYCDRNSFICYLKDVYYTLYYADTATLYL